MPSFLNLTLSVVIHTVILAICMADLGNAVTEDSKTEEAEGAVVLETPAIQLLSNLADEPENPSTDRSAPSLDSKDARGPSVPVDIGTEKIAANVESPPIDYQGGPLESEREENAADLSRPEPNRTFSAPADPQSPLLTASSVSHEGQISEVVDTSGIVGPQLRISSLTAGLINNLALRGLVSIVITDKTGGIFVLDGTLTEPTGLTRLSESHTRRLSSRAVTVPRQMKTSIHAYLARQWGFSSSDVQFIAMHFSSNFDRQILAAQRAAVTASGLTDKAAVTTCRFVSKMDTFKVVVERVDSNP